jgi:hypothetical protein
MSLAALQQDYDEDDADGEEEAEEWDGSVPEDVAPWCKGLHRLITRALGDDCQSGGEPWWYLSNDDEFIADEEERRGLPCGSLKPFSRQPYESEVTITEYTTCRNARVDGLLFGSGEMLGDWEYFTLFYVKPDCGQWRSLEVGQEVQVGKYPFDEDAVVARILRGAKPAGTKYQHCYYALLKVGGEFQYAALQHVAYNGAWLPTLAFAWCEEYSFAGYAPQAATQLARFRPKSVSAVAKAASVYIKKLTRGGREKQTKKRKAPTAKGKAVSKRSVHSYNKAVASESESDGSDEADHSGSDM